MNEYLTKKEAAAMFDVSYRHFRDRLSKEPGFPRPYRVTSHKVFWLRRDLDAWFKSRLMGPPRPSKGAS